MTVTHNLCSPFCVYLPQFTRARGRTTRCRCIYYLLRFELHIRYTRQHCTRCYTYHCFFVARHHRATGLPVPDWRPSPPTCPLPPAANPTLPCLCSWIRLQQPAMPPAMPSCLTCPYTLPFLHALCVYCALWFGHCIGRLDVDCCWWICSALLVAGYIAASRMVRLLILPVDRIVLGSFCSARATYRTPCGSM